MNTSILKKCLDELSKTTPDISYVRGMIETLIEIEQPVIHTTGYFEEVEKGHQYIDWNKNKSPKIVTTDSPEGMAVEAALASLQGVQPNMSSLTIEKNIIL